MSDSEGATPEDGQGGATPPEDQEAQNLLDGTLTDDDGDDGEDAGGDQQGGDGKETAQADDGKPADLGDAGKQAIDRMKQERNAARKTNRQLVEFLSHTYKKPADEVRKLIRDGKLGDLLAQPEPAADGDKGDGKPEIDPDLVRTEAHREAMSKANRRILSAELKAAAKGKLQDVNDAFKFLDLEQFEVSDDGEVDADELSDAIDDLVKNKPYLGVPAAEPAPQQPKFGQSDGGVRNGRKPSQVTQQELAKMSAAERMQAFNDGRLQNLMAGKH